MIAEEIVRFLEAYLSHDQHRASELERPGVALLTCMDGRLNPFLRPFAFVLRTAGAVAEPVEGGFAIAREGTQATFIATHGDCLAYQATIQYLKASFSGEPRSPATVASLNRPDIRPLMMQVNSRWPLNALPDSNDQAAIAELGISYAIQWTARNPGDKPRVGLFFDLTSVLAAQPRGWVVSYDRLSGPDLATFLGGHGMSAQTVAMHVLKEPVGARTWQKGVPGLPRDGGHREARETTPASAGDGASAADAGTEAPAGKSKDTLPERIMTWMGRYLEPH